MDKILFISQRVNNAQSGARMVAERNFQHCLDIFGQEKTTLISIKKQKQNFLRKWILRLRGYLDGAKPEDLHECLTLLHDHSYSTVFIDSSYFGIFAQRIRNLRPDVRIVCFFHDVLVHWWNQTSKSRGLRYLLYLALYRHSEHLSCAFADLRIVLTRRDAETLERIYGPGETHVIPISVPDSCRHGKGTLDTIMNKPPLLLFVGTNYGPNIEGLKWFLTEIKPRIHARIRIVGSGMDSFYDNWRASDVEIVGRVEDLSGEYAQADAVVIPLFSGSGMKVKTCEAIMQGKVIFATSEALIGYEVDGVCAIFRCETADQFVDAICSWEAGPQTRFIPEVRELYTRFYSPSVTLEAYRGVLRPEL